MSQEFNIVGNLLLKVDGAEAGLNKLRSSLSKLKMPEGLENSFKKSFSNLDGILARYKSQIEKGFDTKADVTAFAKTGKALDAELTRISKHFTELTGKEINFRVNNDEIIQTEKELQKLVEQKEQLGKNSLKFNIEGGTNGLKDIETLLNKLKEVGEKTKTGEYASNALDFLKAGNIQGAVTQLDKAAASCKRFGEEKQKAFQETGFDIGTAIQLIIQQLTGASGKFGEINSAISGTQDKLNNLHAEQVEKAGNYAEKLSEDFNKSNSAIRQADGAMQDFARSSQSMAEQVKQLQQSTQYFFGLRNMLNLFKRGIREAVDTVKQLDKAMTETAVVTKYSVGDMWAKLPEYTANANALGATVQDMYESTTLYYQQGLNTQQAMGIATETMKMARIAGLEAAEATDMMTAALRGFNMEINEASAEHINDVYSNLAAKTASNTEELGTAMQRTASIAHSAGMSFEGTAAFLAQAIETTREPAENLGTAMKTIVARFQELKKNPLEITDVEGEEVSYNKVDTALKTIGVDLKDTNGQFRDLDKVFLDISQKWDGLSQTQQRYIATTAAGSRQQSRFIAMMSDYERTMELMGYANNSAGASTTQFNKTLDSLEAKINKFQNAWKQFLMGIMNDSWTKKVVDAGTSVLNIVNKIIDTLSVGGRLKGVKSILSTFTAFTALKMAGRGANALIGGLGGMVDPKSNFRAGAQSGAIGRNSAQAINQPIVKELQSIRALIAQKINVNDLNKSNIKGPYDEYNRLKEARAGISQMKGQGTVGELTKQLSGLSGSSQNLLMSSNAGTFRSATNAIIDAYGSKNRAAVRKGERWLNNERKSARLTAEEYFTALQDPGLLKDAMKRAGIQENNPAYEYVKGLDDAVTARASELQQKVRDRLRKSLESKAAQQEIELTQEDYDQIDAKLNSDKAQEHFRRKALKEQERDRQLPGSKTEFERSSWGKTLDGIGKIGSGISQAGMGIQAFGSILTSSANPALQMFGSALTSIGGLVSGLGMGISGLAAGFTALASSSAMEAVASGVVTIAKRIEATSSLTVAGAATALTGILFGLVAVVAGVAFAIKKVRDNIKKDAEEVTQKYKDKSSENQSNIANLKQWKSELAVLSKGVDENGYNISLDTSDYDHYLEIVDTIAKINPEIVQGYNAQGHAIIDNNKALEDTLALEEKHSKDILRDYTSPDSLTKLLKARNLERTRYAGGGSGDNYIETIEYELKPRTNMRHEMSKIGSELRRNKDLIDLSKLDIDIDALARGEEVEFQKVLNNYDVFKRLVSESIDRAGDEWSDKSREAIEKSLSSFEEYGSDLNDLVQPTYEALSAAASRTTGFKEMASNLKAPFQQALKELATNGEFEDGREIDKAAKNMATKFAGYSEIYIDAMDKVDEANKQFALDFNEQEYDANTEEAIAELESLKATLEDTPEGHAISEWITSEINKIESHLSTGTKSIEEAWDGFSDRIAVAESALDNFNKTTEKDFYSAADDMQKIYETVMDPDAYHTIGRGDNTFWAGAENLLGRDAIMDKTKDEVLGMMKAIEPFLKEGPEGVQNFANKVAELSPELEKISGVQMEDGWFKFIDENANPEAWAQIAEKLQISEELLTSMVNKSRQFKPWDFSDMGAIREAYSIDDSVIHGKQKVGVTTTDAEGKETTVQADKLYITDAELRSRMGSDYYQKKDREEKISALSEQGIEVLPEHLNKLTAQMMKNEMGIADWNAAIKTFGDTGAFDKSEIYDAAKTLAEAEAKEKGETFDEDTFKDQFNEGWTSWLESYENPLADPINTMASDVAAIASKVAGESSADKKEKDDKSDSSKADTSKNKDDEPSRSQSDTKGTTIPGVGFVSKKDITSDSNPYTPEQEAHYSDNHFFAGLFGEIKDKIVESAQKQQEIQEAYKNVRGKETEELEQNKKDFWSFLNTSINDKIDHTNETDSTSTDQSDKNLSTSSESLNDAASQLLSSIQSLNTAGESLNTAGQNLTNAAAVLASINQSGGETSNGMPTGTSGPPAPSQQSSASGVVVVDNSPALASFEELQTKAAEVKTQIETPMSVSLDVQDSGLTNVASKVKTINEGSGDKNINVTATASDPAPVNTLKEAVEAYSKLSDHEVKLTTSLNGATVSGINNIIDAIDDFHKKTSHEVVLTVTYKQNGSKPAATGRHNHKYIAPPSFNSAAGGYGQLGPKGKGGLTLTGELGYEIAWIPSENRSMILGANGPQMVDLPGDAVVWTHEQSKKILKQQSIPAGSHNAKSSGGWDFSGWDGSSTGGGGGGKGGKGGKGSNNNNNNNNNNDAQIEQILQKAGKVVVWWENQARKIDAIQRKADKSLDGFNTLVKNGFLSLEQIKQKVGDQYVQQLAQSRDRNQESYNRATSELNLLTSENGSKASKKSQAKVTKAQNKLNKATTKAEKKKAKKALKKAKAALKGADIETGGTWTNVSYETTKKTKITSGKNKGKTKTTKENKNANVNLSKYLTLDANGVPIINQKEIDKIAKGTKKTKGNKSKAKAIKDAAEAEINKRIQRQREAEDNLIKNHEAEVDYYNQLEDAFHNWTNELTKIYKITNEIEKTEARINQVKAKGDLGKTQIDILDLSRGVIGAGDNFTKALKTVQAAYKDETSLVKKQGEQLKEKKVANEEELKSALKLNAYEKKAAEEAAKAEQGQIIGSTTVYDALSETEKNAYAKKILLDKYLTSNLDGTHSFKVADLEKDIENEKITGELGERLKRYFDQIAEAEKQSIDIDTEIINNEIEKLKLQEEEKEYYKGIADQLYGWKNSLTKILELTTKIEQSEKRTSLLKSANDYYTAKQKAGYEVDSITVLKTYVGQMASVITNIQDQEKLIAQQRQEIQDYITGADLIKELNNTREEFEKDTSNEVLKAQLENLQEEAQYRKDIQKYITTTPNMDGTFTIKFDSEQLEFDKIKNGGSVGTEYYNKIEDYAQELIKKNTELAESIAANVTNVTELYSALTDLKQTYVEQAKELREAYSAQQQKVIDNIKTLYSAIDNNFKELISSIRESIQQRRQVEDNAETEQDISKKQQRLAMLRADTSGGNRVEIAKLEQEIAEAQQSYGRTLEDQLLDKISTQGDEAAKQRQKQIDLMQAQRDIAYQTGQDAAKINKWLYSPEQHEEEIAEVLKGKDNWSALTDVEKENLSTELDTQLFNLQTLPTKIAATEAAINLLGSNIQSAEESIEVNVLDALKETTQAIRDGLTDGLGAIGGDLKSIGDALGVQLTKTTKAIEGIQTNMGEAEKGLQAQIDKINASIKKAEKDQQVVEDFNKLRDAIIENPTTENYQEALNRIDAAIKKWDSLTNDQKKLTNFDIKDMALQRANDAKAAAEAERKRKEEAERKRKEAEERAESRRNIHNAKEQEDRAEFHLETAKLGTGLSHSKDYFAEYQAEQELNKAKKNSFSVVRDEINKIFDPKANSIRGFDDEFVTQTLAEHQGETIYLDKTKTKAIIDKQGHLLWHDGEGNIKDYDAQTGNIKTIQFNEKKFQERAGLEERHGYVYDGIRRSERPPEWEVWIEALRFKNAEKYGHIFKTGGLADFTGPAWLDGTPSKPELVLNAKDTQNFLALRDVLSKALTSTNSVTNSYGGDATYEININVDKLTSDYDVDKVAERVKKIIVKDSSYRNVTQVRNFR